MFLADIDLRSAIFVSVFVLWPIVGRLLAWLAKKAPRPVNAPSDPRRGRAEPMRAEPLEREPEFEIDLGEMVLDDDAQPLLEPELEAESLATVDSGASTATVASSAPLTGLAPPALPSGLADVDFESAENRLSAMTGAWSNEDLFESTSDSFSALVPDSALVPERAVLSRAKPELESDSPRLVLRFDAQSLAAAIAWREILGPPIALQARRF